jgi:FkbM family methyltransferase
VLWSYRLFLGRDPEHLTVLSKHLENQPSLDDLRRHFLQSAEFSNYFAALKQPSVDPAVLAAFPAYTGPGTSGFFTDFLGTRTRCSYLPASYTAASGLIEGPPGTERFGLHEPPEWEGTLRSVLEAGSRFVAVELGAGWGPWLVAGARAAQLRGISDIHLTGVEGASGHHEFLVQHFRDNGLEPERHQLLHAVVGVEDGIARFPKLDVPSADWGAEASYGPEDTLRRRPDQAAEEFDEVRSVSIGSLLATLPLVDLMHCDVQGAEGEVLPAAVEVLSRRVRRIVVGTHGRAIEGRLMACFGASGWVLEHETPCRFNQDLTGAMILSADGTQVWRNVGLETTAD